MSSADPLDRLVSLTHGGLLIAPSRLKEHFPEPAPFLDRRGEERVRAALDRLEADTPDARALLLDVVLEEAIGLGKKLRKETGHWTKGSALGAEWTHRDVAGQPTKPRRVWRGAHGAELPIFVEDVQRIGVHRGRRSHARVVEWLRAHGRPLALLTNARQWRVVHAGLDADAWAESDTSLWFEEGAEGPALRALRTLLGPAALIPAAEGQPGRLMAAVEATRRGQSELSATLGENVRRAVERLIAEHGEALAALCDGPSADDLSPVRERDLYVAGCRVVMRLVVLLFAEAREGLLPLDHPLYRDAYSLGGLREALDRTAGSSARGRLRERVGAWPRLLALFRLVHSGSAHAELPLPRYGGGLFAPGHPEARDPVARAVHVLETACFTPGARVMSDAAVFEVLRLLTQSQVKVRQGRRSTWVTAPVDFSDLSSEYIGILYEGLLDFELKRVAEEDPVVLLQLGDHPTLPLSRLEDMEEKALAALVEKLGKPSKSELSEEDEEESGDEQQGPEPEGTAEESREESSGEDVEEELDRRQEARERAARWARVAVVAGKLVRKTTSKKAEKVREYEEKVDAAARKLVGPVLLPGEWYLVRFGGTRKGSGTYYTKPELAIPTVQRTLRPLAYDPPAAGEVGASVDAPADRWTPKSPEAILALRVCDPACGSGSFLVAALRFLTEALHASLHHHGRIAAQGDRTVVRLADGVEAERLADELLPCTPEDESFEARLRARLRRHVVERCIHGVDLDPLAVELCRLALWVETLDRRLPFTFLDHRIRAGNSLVGCWFDRFRDYPVMAWERAGGDVNHRNGVHFEKDGSTKAIKSRRNGDVRGALADILRGQARFDFGQDGPTPEERHAALAALVERLHALPVHDVEERERLYGEEVAPALAELREEFDAWCAVWFWPPRSIDLAPLPGELGRPRPEAREVVRGLAREIGFFHWELEFPDVFRSEGSGFDAVVGNPPWEIQKPSSKEFFSNVDPLYRTYGKQEAIRRQTELFGERLGIEEDWMDYCGRFKALSNWCKHVWACHGDPEAGGDTFSFGRGDTETLHRTWRERRASRQGLADPEHPFQHQGSADLNSYKLFLEQSHALLHVSRDEDRGRLGMITPSGIYTDKGTGALRELFLDRCSWEWLFGFENRRKVFDIDSRFKFAPLIVAKGGRTESVRAAFMRHDVDEWARAGSLAVPYLAEQVRRFSPNTRAFLEVSDKRDLEILERIYSGSVLLGDATEQGWGVEYRAEFHMTNDSKLFPPRPRWEAKGYEPDEYSRWLLTDWHPRTAGCPAPPDAPRHALEPGVLLSRDGERWTHEDEIHDQALPVYEGSMIGNLDPSQKGWVSGKGRGAKWRRISFEKKTIEPQFLIGRSEASNSKTRDGDQKWVFDQKVSFIDVTSGTNERCMVATPSIGWPCGNTAPVLLVGASVLTVAGALGSLAFDYLARIRCAGTHLNWFVVAEAVVPRRGPWSIPIGSLALSLAGAAEFQAPLWSESTDAEVGWRRSWSATPHERLRKTCALEALVLLAFGLTERESRWVLRDSDLPVITRVVARSLDPKGLWRVDKDLDPELRHTVLSQVAFADLQADVRDAGGDVARGIEAFLARNDGEGWMLPETLRLADYDLGHDARAKTPQSVAERLGPRFYDWQLELTAEESWKECRLHARNLSGQCADSSSVSPRPEEADYPPIPDLSQIAAEGGEGSPKP